MIQYILALKEQQIPHKSIHIPSYQPTNAPAPDIDGMRSGYVAYDIGGATYPDMSAAAGFDPAIQH